MTNLDVQQYIATYYRPRHPSLRQLRDDMLAPALRRALRTGDAVTLTRLPVEVCPAVYAVELFERDSCRALLEELDWFAAWCREEGVELRRPNTMNRYGTPLTLLGLAPLIDELGMRLVRPWAGLLFADTGGDSLDEHHAFVVEYAPGRDVSLAMHVDDSEVTINLCLGTTFTGGDLALLGARCAAHQQTHVARDESFTIAHRPGWAILHRGHHRHAARAIESGERRNLIVWYRSSRFRRAPRTGCPSWCGVRRIGAERPHGAEHDPNRR